VFRAYKCPCASVAKCCAFYVFRNYKERLHLLSAWRINSKKPLTYLGLVCWSKVGNKQSYFSGTSFKAETRHWHLYKSGLQRSKMTWLKCGSSMILSNHVRATDKCQWRFFKGSRFDRCTGTRSVRKSSWFIWLCC